MEGNYFKKGQELYRDGQKGTKQAYFYALLYISTVNIQ